MTEQLGRIGHEAIVPESACPSCGYLFDRASGVDHSSVPHPGDVTVCIRCGAPAFFASDMSLRAPEPDEQLEIAEHAELQKVIGLVKSMRGAPR